MDPDEKNNIFARPVSTHGGPPGSRLTTPGKRIRVQSKQRKNILDAVSEAKVNFTDSEAEDGFNDISVHSSEKYDTSSKALSKYLAFSAADETINVLNEVRPSTVVDTIREHYEVRPQTAAESIKDPKTDEQRPSTVAKSLHVIADDEADDVESRPPCRDGAHSQEAQED